MFAAQTKLRSILSGRFTFKFGSFNWIRFMMTSLCPFTYCTYNSEKVSRYYEKNKKREQSYVECSLSYISSQIRYSCTILNISRICVVFHQIDNKEQLSEAALHHYYRRVIRTLRLLLVVS